MGAAMARANAKYAHARYAEHDGCYAEGTAASVAERWATCMAKLTTATCATLAKWAATTDDFMAERSRRIRKSGEATKNSWPADVPVVPTWRVLEWCQLQAQPWIGSPTASHTFR